MKKIYYFFLILILVCYPLSTQSQSIKNNKLLELVTNILKTRHLQPVDLDDNFSKNVFDDYLKLLDPEKNYFFKSDIKELKKYEYKIDDLINKNDLSFFNISHERVVKRMKESFDLLKQIYSTPMDFTLDEVYSNNDFVSNQIELKEVLRKNIKNILKKKLFEVQESENIKKIKNQNYIPKSFEKIEKEVRDFNAGRLFFTYENPINLSESYFFSLFINSIAMQFDPNSIYIKPNKRDRYKFDALGKFIGFGITFGMLNDQIVVSKFVEGGPAMRDKKLEAGDIILKVSEINKKPIDLLGLHYDFLLKFMSNLQNGTIVNFTVQKADGSIKIISVKKEAFELEDSYIKTCIIVKNKEKFGIIKISKFYEDEEDENGKNVFKDLISEINLLKQEKIKGLVIDLRDNKIGTISMATKLASLFVKRGAMAQIKSLNKEKEILSHVEINSIWDGSLVVWTNKNSSFASEIFAATIQDYSRGIVVGDQKTFGKGTVQEVLDLNLFNDKKSKVDYGLLQVTTKKSYRITGKTVQIKGVLSDVILPNQEMFTNPEEKFLKERFVIMDDLAKNLIQVDQIESLKFEPYSENDFSEIILKSKKRVSENNLFKQTELLAKFIEVVKSDENKSLNFEKYVEENKKINTEIEKYNILETYKSDLNFISTPNDVVLMKKETTRLEKRKKWHEELSKNIVVEEIVNILVDMKK